MGSRTKFLTLRVTGQRWYYERSGGGNTPSTPWRCESPGKGLLPGRVRSLHVAPRAPLGWLQLVTALPHPAPLPREWRPGQYLWSGAASTMQGASNRRWAD